MMSPEPFAKPVLIVFAGLPGTGKSSIAQSLAARTAAIYLRIDTIEQAIRKSPGASQTINEEGYRVAYALAQENLRLEQSVIADSVNPVRASRDAWRDVGLRTGAIFAEVEVICSDLASHRRRVETRAVTVPGLRLPTWADVLAREYEPWNREHLVIDTAQKSIAACANEIHAAMAKLVLLKT
jgi:predicted kinase